MTPNQLPPLPHIEMVLDHPEHHMKWTRPEVKWIQKYATDYALTALAQQAQAQEPVAWMLHLAGKPRCTSVSKPSLDGYHPDFSLRPLVYGDTTPPAPQVPAPVDERAEFEACAPMAGSLFKRRADDPDKYWDGNVQDDWDLWQARAALQSPSPKTKGQP